MADIKQDLLSLQYSQSFSVEGMQEADINLSLPPASLTSASVYGVVLDGVTPVADATVKLFDSAGQPYQHTLADAAGAFSMDGIPAGIPLAEADFEADLARRRGGAAGTTPRREPDLPTIVSGLCNGHTTGAPLTVLFTNTNTRSQDYANVVQHFRPSHADWVANRKFDGYNDPRGGGHFSARLTVALDAPVWCLISLYTLPCSRQPATA